MNLIIALFVIPLSLLVTTQVQAQSCGDYKIVSPLTEQTQDFSDWCTAAAIRVTTSHYGRTFSQCDLVGFATGNSCCPISQHTPGNDPTCHPGSGMWPPEIFNTTMVNFSFTPLYYLTSSPTGPPPWTQIQDEICHDRAMVSVASDASLSSPNWHSVVVEGFLLEVDGVGELHKVRVFDPIEDLCDLSCAPEDQNPRFFTQDAFYNSLYDHHTDYITITPRGAVTTPPPSPTGLIVR